MKIGRSLTKVAIGVAAVCLIAANALPVNANEPEMKVAYVYSYCLTAVGSCEILGAWRIGTPCHCFINGGGYANGEVI